MSKSYIFISVLYIASVVLAYMSAVQGKILPMVGFLCVMIIYPIYKIQLLREAMKRNIQKEVKDERDN